MSALDDHGRGGMLPDPQTPATAQAVQPQRVSVGCPHPQIERIVSLIRSARFNYTSEFDLHRGLAMLLQGAGVEFEREVQLGPHDRIDFLAGDVGLEVKVAGAANETLRQMMRYLEYERVAALVLVTTRSAHRGMPATLRGKPVVVVALQTGIL